MADSADQLDLRQLNEAHQDTLAHRMGIKITEASARRVVGTMPVPGNTQPLGLLHGGASCVLAETLGSTGAALHAGLDRAVVGIEINATHHRAASAGQVTGVATQVHAGRTLTSYEIVISDDDGRRICTARLSCLVRDRVPGRDGRSGLSAWPGRAGERGRRPRTRPRGPAPASLNGCSHHNGLVMAVSARRAASLATVFPGARWCRVENVPARGRPTRHQRVLWAPHRRCARAARQQASGSRVCGGD